MIVHTPPKIAANEMLIRNICLSIFILSAHLSTTVISTPTTSVLLMKAEKMTAEKQSRRFAATALRGVPRIYLSNTISITLVLFSPSATTPRAPTERTTLLLKPAHASVGVITFDSVKIRVAPIVQISGGFLRIIATAASRITAIVIYE